MKIKSCDEHHLSGGGYLAEHADAEIRMARGERQVQCGECGRWKWPRAAVMEQS